MNRINRILAPVLPVLLVLVTSTASAQIYARFYLTNQTPCPTDWYSLYSVCDGIESPLGIEGTGRLGPWGGAGPTDLGCEPSAPTLRLKFVNITNSHYGLTIDIQGDPSTATWSEVSSSCNSVTNINDGDDNDACRGKCCDSGASGGGGGGGPSPGPGCASCTADNSGGIDSGDDDGDTAVGMPRFNVSEPFVSLWLRDVPLTYRPAAGDPIALRLAFKQRENATGTDTNIFGFGKKWNFSWFSYVTMDASGTFTVLYPGGRLHAATKAQDYLTNAKLSGNTNTGFTLDYPDGSKDVYSFLVTNNSGGFIKAFLSEHWNTVQQKTSFYYAGYANGNPIYPPPLGRGRRRTHQRDLLRHQQPIQHESHQPGQRPVWACRSVLL